VTLDSTATGESRLPRLGSTSAAGSALASSTTRSVGVRGDREDFGLQTARTDLPYVRGRAEFDSVFGDLAKGKRNWQLAAFGALGLAFILGGGLIVIANRSHITPYVVEVDRLGQAQAFGPAEQLHAVDQRLIVSQLARFIRDIRTVLGDAAGQADLIKRAYAFVDRDARPFLNAYFTTPANDPRVLGKDITRLVEVTSVLAVPTTTANGAQTWKVSWTETTMLRDGGGAPTEAAWEGYFTTRLTPPSTLDRITLNPLGLYITSINWTELAKRVAGPGGGDRNENISSSPVAQGAAR